MNFVGATQSSPSNVLVVKQSPKGFSRGSPILIEFNQHSHPMNSYQQCLFVIGSPHCFFTNPGGGAHIGFSRLLSAPVRLSYSCAGNCRQQRVINYRVCERTQSLESLSIPSCPATPDGHFGGLIVEDNSLGDVPNVR